MEYQHVFLTLEFVDVKFYLLFS